MRKMIYTQIQQAIQKKPALDGILHGVREIRQGKHGSRSSLFYSAKNGALMPVESRLERHYCYQLEADKSITCYRTQALAVPCGYRSLFPDFLIVGTDGIPYVREVKCSVFVDSRRNAEKAQYLSNTLESIGINFGVVTELDFWSGQEKINRVMTYDRGGRLSMSCHIAERVVDLVMNLTPIDRTVAIIRNQLHQHQLPVYLLDAAIFVGLLSCDMRMPIDPSTRIEVAS